MKKLFALAALAATAVSLGSCGFLASVASSIATTPTFTCTGDGTNDGVFDGQSLQLTKMSTCNYAWEVSDPAQLVLKTSGSTATVTGSLKNHAVGTTVRITARNADDATIEPVVKDCPVFAWDLKVYDVADNLIQDPTKLVRNNTYTVKMVRIGGSTSNPVFTPVTKLYKAIKISQTEDLYSLNFSLSSSQYQKVSQTALTYTFKTPSKAASCTISTSLGSVSKKISIATK